MHTYQFILGLAKELKWPVAIVILGVIALVIARDEVRDFIKRMYWISPTGVKAARQNPQIASTNTGSGPVLASPDFTQQLSATVDPYVLSQRVNTIYAEFDSRGIRPGEREEHLVSLLAAALIREAWERTYLWIFGTQMRLLQKLNETPQGLREEEDRGIYQIGASQYPEVFKAYSFENWIAFMQAAALTMKDVGPYLITPNGRGFLKYVVAQGLSFDRPN